MTDFRTRVQNSLDNKRLEKENEKNKQLNLAKRREARHTEAIKKNKELLTSLNRLLIDSDGKEIKLSDAGAGALAVYYNTNRTLKDGTYILKDGSTLMINMGKVLLHNKSK